MNLLSWGKNNRLVPSVESLQTVGTRAVQTSHITLPIFQLRACARIAPTTERSPILFTSDALKRDLRMTHVRSTINTFIFTSVR